MTIEVGTIAFGIGVGGTTVQAVVDNILGAIDVLDLAGDAAAVERGRTVTFGTVEVVFAVVNVGGVLEGRRFIRMTAVAIHRRRVPGRCAATKGTDSGGAIAVTVGRRAGITSVDAATDDSVELYIGVAIGMRHTVVAAAALEDIFGRGGVDVGQGLIALCERIVVRRMARRQVLVHRMT